MSEETVTFLLVGKTGVGKSALGNSILGENVFESSNSPDSVTREICVKSIVRSNSHVTVVDTPGFMATNLKTKESKVQACEDMKKAMSVCPTNGKLAVIFVIKYNERSTEENKTSLKIMEKVFGKNNVWLSCIIVMTFGDTFDTDYEKKPFLEYLKEQSGEFGELFKKCKYLCVLFRNKTKKVEEKRKQFEMLMNCVNNLDQGYTYSKFQEAIKGQNRIALKARLPALKQKFQQIIQSLTDGINNIQFSPESSTELGAIQHGILYNLAFVDKEDAPDKIYYKGNEPRLLEDIRASFVKMLDLIGKKKEDFRQMMIAQDFFLKINEIKMKIAQTDPNNTEILSLLNSFEENIKDTTKQIKAIHLKNEISESLKNHIKISRKELDNLKLRALKEEEFEINKKKEDIIQRLNNFSTHDNDATEHLRRLKNEVDILKGSLEKEHTLINKQFVEVIKSSLTQIIRDIKDKEETVRQFKIAYDLNMQIEKITQEIINTEPTNEDVYRFFSDVEGTLKSLKTVEKKEQLRKFFTDSLKLSTLDAQKHLQTLKNEVHKRKETEIKTLLKSITEKVTDTDCQDKEALTILSHARTDLKSLINKLDQEKNRITDVCIATTKIKLNEIEKAIKLKEQTAQQWLRTDHLMRKINDVTKAIEQINPSDENITETISKLKAEVLQLQKETKESNVGEKFLQRLNESVQTAEKRILNATNLIEKIRKGKIESEIEEIKEKINKLDMRRGSCQQGMEQIKAHLNGLQSKIEQEELHEDIKSYLISKINLMHLDINFKNEDATQRNIARNIMKNIQALLSRIDDTSITQENIFATLTGIEVEVLAFKTKIAEADLSEAIKIDLFSALEGVVKILNKRKQDTINTIESDLQSILNKIKDANPDDVNITVVQSDIKEKLELLKPRIVDTLKEKYKQCENNFADLVSRVVLFHDKNADIDSLIKKIKLLDLPCSSDSFDDLKKDVKKIKENVTLITNENDLDKINKKIERCEKVIEWKSDKNGYKKAGNFVSFTVPVFGPLIRALMTYGIDKEERSMLLNLK